MQLRPMTTSDLPRVLAWRNHPDIRFCMHAQQVISAQEHAAWFARNEHDSQRCLLIAEEQSQPLGFLQFTICAKGVAEWGFYLAPCSMPGSGSRLCRAGIAHGFEKLGLTRINASVLTHNTRSLRLHHRLGFTPVTEEAQGEVSVEQPSLRFTLTFDQWKRGTPP